VPESPPRICLITGAAGNLGSAMARHLSAQGWRVALHYHTSETAARQLEKELPGSAAFQADLTCESEAARMVAAVLEHFGALGALINNAGTFTGKKLEALTESDWHIGLRSTLHTAFFTTRAALPALRTSRHGRIVNIGDTLAPQAGFTEPAFSYHLGKTGVWMLTQTLAALEAQHGVTVNCLSPGMLETSLGRRPLEHLPTGRYAKTEDLFGALDLLLSKESSQVTGAHLPVAGGWNIAPWFRSVHDPRPPCASTTVLPPRKDGSPA
jgi:3-oxoacyl-[acyl-carrier protein] reductase